MEFFLFLLICFSIYFFFFRSKKKITQNTSTLFPDENIGMMGKSKIFMCIKEFKWALEAMSISDRAYVLAMATFYRLKILDEIVSGFSLTNQIFCKPLNFGKIDLLKVYNILESTRNNNTKQRELTEKNFKKMFGIPMKSYQKGHAIASERALEVWMITVAFGIAENKTKEIKEIWQMLNSSIDSVPNAIKKIYEFPKKMEEDMGTIDYETSSMFNSINEEEWINESLFTPSFMSK